MICKFHGTKRQAVMFENELSVLYTMYNKAGSRFLSLTYSIQRHKRVLIVL